MLGPVDVLVPSVRDPAASIASARRAAPGIELRFHLVEDTERRGPAWARNEGARRGTAQLIALLDDDDRWLPGRLAEALVILAERPDVALVCGDAVLPGGGLFLSPTRGGRRRAVEPGDHDHAALVADCFVCTSTVTLRRADWERAGGMPEDLRNAEDYALWLRLTAGGRSVHVLPDVLVRYGLGDRSEALDSDLRSAVAGTREALRREAKTPVPITRFGLVAALRDWRS